MESDCLFCKISQSKTDTEMLYENDKLVMVAQEMAVQQGIDKSGYRIFINVERGGGQVIFHLHMHVIGGWH